MSYLRLSLFLLLALGGCHLDAPAPRGAAEPDAILAGCRPACGYPLRPR